MKTKIVLCCHSMLAAVAAKEVFVDGALKVTPPAGKRDFDFCPWCGGKLPFSFEEKP